MINFFLSNKDIYENIWKEMTLDHLCFTMKNKFQQYTIFQKNKIHSFMEDVQ
jgi:hypothetical protein